MVHKQRRSWLALATLAAALACHTGAHAAEPELTIDMRLLPDGALQVRYTPPPETAGVPRELPFYNPVPHGADAWRASMATPADACTELTPRSLRIKPGPECNAATLRVQPRAVAQGNVYQPAYALGEGGLAVYTGHYAVLLPGAALRWRWWAPQDGYVVQAGSATPQRQQPFVEQQASAALVAQGLRGNSFENARLIGSHQYVWLGRQAPEELAEGVGTLVMDARLPPAQAERVRRDLLADMAALKAAYGMAPDGPVGVLVSLADPRLFHGETTDGRMMRLQLGSNIDSLPGSTLERFIAHETTHWWNMGMLTSDPRRPWMHEGHAEWAALLLLHQAGQLSSQEVGAAMEAAINGCLMTRGNTPAAQLPLFYPPNEDPYACGLALMVLAQWQHRTRRQDAGPPLAELASLHSRTGMLGVNSFAQWADGPPRMELVQGMYELLTSLDMRFAPGYLARVQHYGLGSLLPTEDASLPANVRLQPTYRLMAQVTVADCQGSFSYNMSASGIKFAPGANCRHLRTGDTLLTVEGVPVYEQPAKAWQAAAQACAQGRPLRTGYAGGAEADSDCPKGPLVPPLPKVVKLAPDVLKQLGL